MANLTGADRWKFHHSLLKQSQAPASPAQKEVNTADQLLVALDGKTLSLGGQPPKPGGGKDAAKPSTTNTPGTTIMKAEGSKQVYFFNGDQVGPSPAQAKKTINWLGTLKSAKLILEFGGKFGWELQQARINDSIVKPSVTNNISADITNSLINGDNILTVDYAAPFTAQFGDRATLTAYVEILAEIAPGIGGLSVDYQSLNILAGDLDKRLANATVPTIAILALIAIIAIAGAIILLKLTGILGGFKP